MMKTREAMAAQPNLAQETVAVGLTIDLVREMVSYLEIVSEKNGGPDISHFSLRSASWSALVWIAVTTLRAIRTEFEKMSSALKPRCASWLSRAGGASLTILRALSFLFRNAAPLNVVATVKSAIATASLSRNLLLLIEDLRTLNSLFPQVISITFDKVRLPSSASSFLTDCFIHAQASTVEVRKPELFFRFV